MSEGSLGGSEVVGEAGGERVVVEGSTAVPWRCCRRLREGGTEILRGMEAWVGRRRRGG